MNIGCTIVLQLKFGILRNTLVKKCTNAVNLSRKICTISYKKQSGTTSSQGIWHPSVPSSHAFLLLVISITPTLLYLVVCLPFMKWTLGLFYFHNFSKHKNLYWHTKSVLRTTIRMQRFRYLLNYLFPSKRNFYKWIYQVFLVCFSSKYFLDSLCKSIIHWRGVKEEIKVYAFLLLFYFFFEPK